MIKYLILLKIENMMDVNVDLLQWFKIFLIKKLQLVLLKKKQLQNEELVKELHKSIIRKFERRKVHSSSMDNIGGADLADIQLIRKFNKGFRFSLCVIDIYSTSS